VHLHSLTWGIQHYLSPQFVDWNFFPAKQQIGMGCERWRRPGPLPGRLGWSRCHRHWPLPRYNNTRTRCSFGNLCIYWNTLPDCSVCHWGCWYELFFVYSKWTMVLNGPVKVLEETFHGRKMPLFRQAIQCPSRIPSISWLPTSSSNSSFQIKQWVLQKGCGLREEHSRNYAYALTLFPWCLSIYGFPLKALHGGDDPRHVSMPRNFSSVIYSAIFWRPTIISLMLPLLQKMRSLVSRPWMYHSPVF